MFSAQDERLIIDYILNVLDEEEEKSVSERLMRDDVLRHFYKKMLRVLRPILSARTIEEDEQIIRNESKGLASRTLAFLRLSSNAQMEKDAEMAVQMIETAISTQDETKVEQNSELKPEVELI